MLDEIAEATDAGHGSFDVNSGKDVYFKLSYKIGGIGVFGSGESDVLAQTNNWRDNSLTLGGYYYRGSQGAFLENADALGEAVLLGALTSSAALRIPRILGAGDEETGEPEETGVFDPSGNEFYRTGVSFDAWLWDFNVFGAWQRNHDELADGRQFDLDIPMVEVDYVTPWPWVQPAVRFEQIRPDFGSNVNRYTLSLTLLIRANVVVSFDGSLSSESAPELSPFDDQFRTGVRFYF